MNVERYLRKERNYYHFLIMLAIASSAGYSSMYFLLQVPIAAWTSSIACALFMLIRVWSSFRQRVLAQFRCAVAVCLITIYILIFYTGGPLSPVLPLLIILPLIGYFYYPKIDRYVLLAASIVIAISFIPISYLGFSEDAIPQKYATLHNMVCSLFLICTVAVYAFLYRTAVMHKSKKIGDSMKQLQETTHKLIQSEKMASLGVMSAGVAHEINNPLNFIKGGIEVLEEGLKKEKLDFEFDPCIHVVKEGLNRAVTIVNSLNHFSRQTDSMEEQCDLHSILNNSIVMLQPKLKFKGRVVKKYSEIPVIIAGNEGKLHQAFLNLIANAEQAIQQRGIITIVTKIDKKKAVVEIEDSGVGISKEHLTKISDPFFTTKPVGEGTGLGLSITYKIVQEHNGEINVLSKPGKGTKFTLTFHLN